MFGRKNVWRQTLSRGIANICSTKRLVLCMVCDRSDVWQRTTLRDFSIPCKLLSGATNFSRQNPLPCSRRSFCVLLWPNVSRQWVLSTCHQKANKVSTNKQTKIGVNPSSSFRCPKKSGWHWIHIVWLLARIQAFANIRVASRQRFFLPSSLPKPNWTSDPRSPHLRVECACHIVTSSDSPS